MAEFPKEVKECNINYVDCDDMVSVTLYEAKHIKKVRELYKAHPDEVRLIETGLRGVICAHLPKKYVRIGFSDKQRKGRAYSEEDKARVVERFRVAREKKEADKRANMIG